MISSAASAAAAAAGRSLTRRGVARRLHVVTPRIGRGEREADPGRAHAWADGLGPDDTVVLYMAGRIAADCARALIGRGFAPDVPALAVRGASWPDESVERTTLARLAAEGLAIDDRPVVLLVGRAMAARDALAAARRIAASGAPAPALALHAD